MRGESTGPTEGLPFRRRLYRRLTPAYIRRRYAAKFVLSLLLIVAVIGVIGFVTYIQIQGTIQEDATERVGTTAQLQSEAVGQWVDGMRDRTTLIADGQWFSNWGGDIPELNRYLSSVDSRAGPAVLGLHYVDADADRVVASTRGRYRNRSVSAIDQPWSAPIAASLDAPDPTVTASNRSYRHGPDRALAFVTRTDADGLLVAVTRFNEQSVGLQDATNGVRTTLLNRQGAAVLDDGGTTSLADASAFDRAVTGATETLETDGQVRSYTPIEGTGWIAVSTADISSLYSVSRTVSRNLLFLIAVGLLSVVVVGIVLGRGTVSPLVELRRRTRDIEDGNLDVDLSTTREDEIGRLYAAFESMRDALGTQVTEAERAKREAERSRKEMERQNRRLDEFASTLSHDLRNPLAVARGHVELLDTKLDPDDEDRRQHVSKIDGAHDRIDSIINDVLTLTRKGEAVDETARLDLGTVADEAWHNIDSKSASLTVEDTVTIDADRNRLLRALENLFRNAIDHGSEDVSVTVGLTENGFYVQDDGPGIPDEEVGNIFEYGHTTSDDGTGIGLSIVKTIAEAHGWSLWIDGTYQRGARFVFADVFESEERVFEETGFTWDHAESPTDD